MRNSTFRRTRWFASALLATGAFVALPLVPAQAQGVTPAVDLCRGISVDQTSLRNVLTATNTPITAALQAKINALAGLPVLGGLVTPLTVDVAATVNTAVTANPLTLNVLDTAGNPVVAGACNLASDALTLNTQGGIAIGGNVVTGLGLNGLAASAGSNTAIALGNNASTSALATGAVAIGTGASVTAANGVALGNGSVADRGALAGYLAAGITGPSNSVGTISVGATGALRQLTNLAPGSALTDAATVGQVQGALDAVAGANAQIGTNTTAIAGLTTSVSGLTTGLAALDGRVTGNTGAIATLNGTVTALDGRVTGNTGAIATLNGSLTALDGRVTGNTGAIAALTTDVGTLTGQVAGNTGAIATLNGTVTALDGRVTGLAGSLASLAADVASNTGAMATMNGALSTLNGTVSALDGRVTGLVGDVAGLTTGLATLGTQVAGNTTAIANIDARVLNNTNAITNIDARVASNTTQLGNIDARVTLNTTAITNLQNQVANVPVGYVQDGNPAVPSSTPTNTAAMIGVGGAAVRLTNVAAGTLAAGSSDAVNGGQLAATNTALAANVAVTTANQAAIATLDAAAVKYDNAAKTSVTLAGAGGTRLTNVAAGTVAPGSSDAVNGAQLAATNAQVTQNTTAITNITTNLRGSTVAVVQYSNADTPTTGNGGTITNDATLVGATAAPVALHNVAAGRGATDAVNLGQMQSQITSAMAAAQSYSDSRLAAALSVVGSEFARVDFDLSELRKDAMSGVASAMAFAGIPQTMDASKSMVGGAVAHYRGRTAFALGFSSALADGKAAVKLGGSVDSSGHLGVTAGGGISF